jgi:hypothetical protein
MRQHTNIAPFTPPGMYKLTTSNFLLLVFRIALCWTCIKHCMIRKRGAKHRGQVTRLL